MHHCLAISAHKEFCEVVYNTFCFAFFGIKKRGAKTEPSVYFICIGTVYVTLRHHGEFGSINLAGEIEYLRVGARFLLELITREGDDLEALFAVPKMSLN